MMRDFIYSASLNGNATEQETKQLLELKALVNVNAKGENPMAVALFLTFLSTFCPDENKVYADTEDLLENEEQKEQIGSFMSSEDYQIVGKVALFLSSGNEIVGEKKGSHKNKKDIP
ncbi:28503_t:CDS:2, partial [Racocetra persica]